MSGPVRYHPEEPGRAYSSVSMFALLIALAALALSAACVAMLAFQRDRLHELDRIVRDQATELALTTSRMAELEERIAGAVDAAAIAEAILREAERERAEERER